MDATASLPAPLTRPHPLLLVAAASVTAVSLAGVAVLAGWLPGPAPKAVEAAGFVQAPAATPAPISIQQTVTVPQEKSPPKPKALARTSSAPPAVHQVALPSPPPVYVAASPAPTPVVSTPAICADCGVVDAVREVAVDAKGSGGGAIAGGLVGGYIGNQIGKGTTRDIATLLGAVGGAYAGNHIEKSAKEAKRYEVVVRFDDGSMRNFSSDTRPDWQAGDRIRLRNGVLVSRTAEAGLI